MDVNMFFSVFLISTFIAFSATTSERRCGRLKEPLNGRVNVETYSVGGIARYTCNVGYRLQGRTEALCMSNGEFDPSQPPVCKQIICPPLGPLYNGRIDYTEKRLTWGTVAMFTCNADSDQIITDRRMATCEQTGFWSGSKPGCFRKAIIRPIKRGDVFVGGSDSTLKKSKSVKHGTTVILSCNSETELYSTEESRYLNREFGYSMNYNGTWSPALPECVFKRCILREKYTKKRYWRYTFTFPNGTNARAKVDHNTELLGSCVARYEFEDEYDKTPQLFTCNKGNISLKPKCVPAFCSVSLATGMYFDTGKSEKNDDIGRIPHGTTINFRCSNDREYKLFLRDYIDSVSDTCSYGQWLENVRPICKEKRCYLQVYEGAVFLDEQYSTINARRYVESGRKIYIKCRRGFRLVEDERHAPNNMVDRYSTCSKGKWSRNLQCKQDQCRQPSDFGTCRDDIKVMWFYNITSRKCERFWYGGCNGNDNRFKSEKECETICTGAVQRDNNLRPTTVTASASVLTTSQEQSDSNEYISSTSTLAYNGSEFDVSSGVIDTQVNLTIDRFDETVTGVVLHQKDNASLPKRQLQCDLIIRQSGYVVEDTAIGFGGDSVYLTCDARCKGPEATAALAWFKEPSMTAIPSTRGRVSSYGRSSNRVQRLIIHFFLQRDVGRYTCKGWLGLVLGWVEKSIWLQMGCTHPRIACDIYQCLPEKYRCDGVRHCEDGFDEYECGSDSCNKKEFYCDGRCHDIRIRCNAEVDCHDYLDEMNCQEEQKTTWEPGINYDYDIEDYNATETMNTTVSAKDLEDQW